MRQTAKKLKRIFETGYISERGDRPYFGGSEEIANCLEHGFFGLKDVQLLTSFKLHDADVFSCFYLVNQGKETSQRKMIDLLVKTGLTIEDCKIDAILKSNQWKVAIYFNDKLDEINRSFHILRQEKEGFWTGKHGWNSNVDSYPELPKKLYDYTLFNTLKITSPYVKPNENKILTPTIKQDENE